MKSLLSLLTLLLFSPLPFGSLSQSKLAAKYAIVIPESRVEFFVSSTFADVHGVFQSWQGELKLPARGSLDDAQFNLQISAASMTTGSHTKDNIIKGEKFFFVKKFPSITFTSRKAIPSADPAKFQLQGDFTLHGVSKPVTIQVTLDPEGQGRGQIYGDLSFDRRDFGMTHNMPFNRVSDTVRVRIDLDVEPVVAK